MTKAIKKEVRKAPRKGPSVLVLHYRAGTKAERKASRQILKAARCAAKAKRAREKLVLMAEEASDGTAEKSMTRRIATPVGTATVTRSRGGNVIPVDWDGFFESVCEIVGRKAAIELKDAHCRKPYAPKPVVNPIRLVNPEDAQT